MLFRALEASCAKGLEREVLRAEAAELSSMLVCTIGDRTLLVVILKSDTLCNHAQTACFSAALGLKGSLMKKISAVAFLTLGVVIGIGGTTAATELTDGSSASKTSATAKARSSMTEMNTPTSSSPSSAVSSMSMDHMTASLKGQTDDDFDRKFLSEMTGHHQGALNMARLAAVQAKHQEVKHLASDIIASQTSQINEMKQWQKDWGYAQ